MTHDATDRLELWEDNAGGLYWVHGDRAIDMGQDPEPGTALDDAMAWGEWAPYHLDHNPADADEVRDTHKLVATYHLTDRYYGGAPRAERWVIETDHVGHAAARYLGVETEG